MDQREERADAVALGATPERRHHVRRQPASLSYVEMGEENGGIVLNLSEGGLAVQSAVPMMREQLSHVRFQVPDSWNWVEADGQIAWISESNKEAGVRFVNLPELVRSSVANWVLLEFDRDSTSPNREAEPAFPEGPQPPIISDVNRSTGSASAPSAPAKADEDFWAPTPPTSAPPSSPIPAPPPMPSLVPRSFEAPLPATALDSTVVPGSGVKSPPPINLSLAKPYAARAARGGNVVLPGTALPESLSRPMGVMNPPNGDTSQNSSATTAKPSPRWKSGLLICAVAAGSLAAGVSIGNGSMALWLQTARKFVQVEKARTNFFHGPTNPLAPASAATAAAPSGDNTDANATLNRLPANILPATRGTDADNAAALQQQVPVDSPASLSPNANALTLPADQSPVGILISAPEPGQPALRLNVPPSAVSASSSIAVSSQRSLMVPPIPPGAEFHRTERLQIGNLQVFVPPEYPAEAKDRQIEGTVELEATINQDGTVRTIRFVSGTRSLAQAAINAIEGWRYKPTLLDGQSIETQDDITIEFRLP